MIPTLDIIYCFRNKDAKRVKNSLDTLALQTTKNFNVIFIDYGSDENIAEQTKSLCLNYNFCKYIYVDTLGKIWNRADALNHGFYFSEAEHVFTSDIDMLFYPTFIEEVLKSLNENEVKFYGVGYLSEKQTNNINVNTITTLKYKKSKNYALGMMLVSKNIIKKINGYNSFYAIWGQEDNDIKYRIETNGFTTKFEDEKIYLLHQYHLPATLTDLPIGWRQYLTDYFENYKIAKTNFLGLNEINSVTARPAKKLYFDKNLIYTLLPYRNLFFKHQVINAINNSNSGNYLAYQFDLNAHKLQHSGLQKVSNFLNLFFTKIKLPLQIKSIHINQYVVKNEIRDEIYFILK